MRELKFRYRILLEDNSEIVKVFTIEEIEQGIKDFKDLKIKRYLREQYTGWKDETGCEIYENDVLEWYIGHVRNVGHVVYEDWDASFSCKVVEPVQNVWIKLNAFPYKIIGTLEIESAT